MPPSAIERIARLDAAFKTADGAFDAAAIERALAGYLVALGLKSRPCRFFANGMQSAFIYIAQRCEASAREVEADTAWRTLCEIYRDREWTAQRAILWGRCHDACRAHSPYDDWPERLTMIDEEAWRTLRPEIAKWYAVFQSVQEKFGAIGSTLSPAISTLSIDVAAKTFSRVVSSEISNDFFTSIPAAGIFTQTPMPDDVAIWSDANDRILEAIEAGLGGLWLTSDEIVVVPRPALRADAQNRPHCEDGPAVTWPTDSGEQYYFWHGVEVPRHVIEAPATIHIDEIEREQNLEIRRVLIERFGERQYLLASGARIAQQDRYGVLYRVEDRQDGHALLVQVLNATPEPDGAHTVAEAYDIFGQETVDRVLDRHDLAGAARTACRFKSYFIRVPPHITTAHEGVAWTFGLTPEQYAPVDQT